MLAQDLKKMLSLAKCILNFICQNKTLCLTKLCEIMMRNYKLKMYLGNVRICLNLELRWNLTNA